MTLSERFLWKELRDKKLGLRIYTQSVIFGYIVDFWCPCGIVIEIDGSSHIGREGYDKVRDLRLGEHGIRTLRFTDKEVLNNRAAVLALIRHAIETKKYETERNKIMGRSGSRQKRS
jgi:very-short-patch-repair endonuclease